MEAVDVGGMRLPRVEDGQHLLKVVRCTTPRTGDVAFIVEFEVVQSSNPSHRPGEQRSVYLSSKFRDSMQRTIKAVTAAICGYDPKDDAAMAAFSPHSPHVARAAISEHNALEGRTVACQGVPGTKVSAKTGRPFVDYVWLPAEPPMPLPLPGGAPPAYAPPPAAMAPGPFVRPAYAPPPAPAYAPPPAAPPGWKIVNGQWVQG